MGIWSSTFASVVALLLTAPGLRAQDIHAASARGDSAAVAGFLSADSALVGALDAQRRTPLHVAAGAGRTGVAALLLSRGAPLEARDAADLTPLGRAAFGSQAEVARLLLDRGADPNARSARLGGGVADVAFLREAYGDAATVTRLLRERGAAFDPNGSLRGATRLYLASTQPNLAMLRWLLDLGADPNDGGPRGANALHNAANRGHVEAVRLLLDRGAEVGRPRADGLTALRLAVDRGHAPVVRLLLERGADPRFTESRSGRSLLHTAALMGHLDVVDALLARGVAPSGTDSAGRTPLDYARRYGHARVASLLADRGARPSRDAGRAALPSLPRRGLRQGEAMAWYLANRGWAVRTASHVLVFDAEEFGLTRPTEPSLANGFLTPGELRDVQVVAAYTAYHGEPGEPGEPGAYVHLLEDSIPRIAFVHNAGDRWRGSARTTYLRPRADTVVAGIRLATIDASPGQMTALGHLATVDGVVMYYMGFAVTDTAALTRELEWLAARAPRVDLAFLPVPEPEGDDAQLRLLVERLHPHTVALLDPNRRVELFPAAAALVRAWRPGTTVFTAENAGDRFLYRR